MLDVERAWLVPPNASVFMRVTCPALPPDPGMVEADRRRARSGDIDGAIAIFRRFRTSRGVAKAMMQRRDEAIADFEAFLAWEANEQKKRMGFLVRQRLRAERLRHEMWIAALRAGRNPFTAEERKMLLAEESSR